MRYEVTHGHRTYTVVEDRTVVVAAAVTGRFVDETTGEAIRVPATLHVDHPQMRGRVVEGGRFAISALPEVDLPHLATDAYEIEALVRVPTFVHRELAITLPAGTSLPLETGDLALRRRPVRVRGRVTHGITGQGIAGALVFASAPVVAQQVLAVRWPLRFDHAAGIEVRRRRLDEDAVATALVHEARGGGQVVTLADRSGFGDGDVVRLGTGEVVEFAVIESLSAEPADPALPGEVTLTAPLYRGFPAGAPVRRMDPAVVPQTRALTADAHAGDGVLLLDGPIAPDTVDTIEVRDPGHLEYHMIGAVTDADGHYALDGAGRVAELRLVARSTGLSEGARTVAVDYGAGTNFVNFRLEP